MVDQDQIGDILHEHIESEPIDGRCQIIEIILWSEEVLEIRLQESDESGGKGIATQRVTEDIQHQAQQEAPHQRHLLGDGRWKQQDEVDIQIGRDKAQELDIVQEQYLEQQEAYERKQSFQCNINHRYDPFSSLEPTFHRHTDT